ncbi:MAG TPA: FAD-dependent oxidoreductase, partial [Phycisphaeraceae bacterium]
MVKVADVVVIGAGVHGASTAFHLARAGAGKIVLLEQGTVASGPTAKSGAMIRPIFTEAAYIQLVMQSIEMFENWSDAVGGDPGFAQCGFLRITDSFDPPILGGDLELMRRLGVEAQVLSLEELSEHVPGGRLRGDEQGLWIKRGGYADPVQTSRCLVEAATRLGVTLLEGVRVTGISTDGDRIEAVQTGDGAIATRTIVNCAGPWAPRLAGMIHVSLPIEAHRTPTCLFRRPEAVADGGPILSDGVNRIYLRQMGPSLLR